MPRRWAQAREIARRQLGDGLQFRREPFRGKDTRGNEYLRVVLGLRGKIVGREADAFVKSAVDLCMYGIAAPDKAGRASKASR
jgi:hypothetical protein